MAIDSQIPTAAAAATIVIPEGHRISWGAVFAGVTLFMALSWLLLLLGAALGAGIADATDLAAMGDGLSTGSVIWLLLTSLIATFAGAMMAAKLAGTADDRIGALHGVTVWSVGTLLIIVLGASGTGGAINAVSGVLGSATQVSNTIITTASSDEDGDLLPKSVTTSAAVFLKRQTSRLITATASGSDRPNRSEVRSAISSLSAQDTAAVASALVAGDIEEARTRLAQRTNLSGSEINSIIQGASDKAEQWSASGDLQQAEEWVSEQMRSARRSVSRATADMAGAAVSSREVNRALQQLDSETLIEAGQYLVMGKPEMSKNVLAANTNLSEADIEAIVDGAEKEAQKMVNEARAEINEATEAIGTFTQAALWVAFIAAALGLAAGLIGGQMGAGTIKRLYAAR